MCERAKALKWIGIKPQMTNENILRRERTLQYTKVVRFSNPLGVELDKHTTQDSSCERLPYHIIAMYLSYKLYRRAIKTVDLSVHGKPGGPYL